MAERYLPSNGTDGECFIAAWCGKCARDRCVREGVDFDACAPEDQCDILTNSFVVEVDEWVYGDDGVPMCTAFVPAGEPVKHRCAKTVDMFEGGAA